MHNRLRRPVKNRVLFVIVNTIFWIGLAALLLTDPLRLAVGGSLLALVLGGYLFYAGCSNKITRGMADPSLARMMAIAFGLTGTVFGIAMLTHALSGNVLSLRQARQQALQEQLDQAARGHTWLDLSDNGLRDIPSEVWEFEHLTELDLSDNKLVSLPPEVARLVNLEHLYLDGNRLEALPPEIGQFSHLEWLDLDGNRLTVLPPEFAHLQSLTHLQIQYNRWTTFPAVILELPNLELLFLAGNRLGELPPAITERAEAGELELWYRPNASRVDWSLILVISVTFVLPTVLSWSVNRWWTTRELAQQQAAQQTGAVVFPIPPMLRIPTLFVVFALSATSLFVLIAALNGPRTNVTLETGVGLCLIFSPLIAGGVIFLLHNTGMVLLTAETVELRRPGRKRLMSYSDIVALRSQSRLFSPGLLIQDETLLLRIPRTLKNLPRLYELLLARVLPTVRDAALGKTAIASDVTASAVVAENNLLYAFGIRKHVWILYAVGTLFFILTYLGIGLMGLWIGLARGDVPPFTTPWARDTALFFLMISVFFVPALVYVLRRLFTQYGPFRMKQPVALKLYQDRICYRFPRRPWQEAPAHTLQRVMLEPLSTAVRGGRGIEQEITRHVVVLELVENARLAIDQERAVQFGETPERLYMILKNVYDL